jgi:hypothetical protein
MKSWFAKFRISNALDARTFPPTLRRKIGATDELRRYAVNQAALGDALKRAAPESTPPPALHGSILRAIRLADQHKAPSRSGFEWRWLAPAALAPLVLVGIFVLLHRPQPPAPPLNIASVARTLEGGQELAQSIPAVTAPLSDEFARLNTDLSRTEQFLLAEFPSSEGVEGKLNQ